MSAPNTPHYESDPLPAPILENPDDAGKPSPPRQELTWSSRMTAKPVPFDVFGSSKEKSFSKKVTPPAPAAISEVLEKETPGLWVKKETPASPPPVPGVTPGLWGSKTAPTLGDSTKDTPPASGPIPAEDTPPDFDKKEHPGLWQPKKKNNPPVPTVDSDDSDNDTPRLWKKVKEVKEKVEGKVKEKTSDLKQNYKDIRSPGAGKDHPEDDTPDISPPHHNSEADYLRAQQALGPDISQATAAEWVAQDNRINIGEKAAAKSNKWIAEQNNTARPDAAELDGRVKSQINAEQEARMTEEAAARIEDLAAGLDSRHSFRPEVPRPPKSTWKAAAQGKVDGLRGFLKHKLDTQDPSTPTDPTGSIPDGVEPYHRDHTIYEVQGSPMTSWIEDIFMDYRGNITEDFIKLLLLPAISIFLVYSTVAYCYSSFDHVCDTREIRTVTSAGPYIGLPDYCLNYTEYTTPSDSTKVDSRSLLDQVLDWDITTPFEEFCSFPGVSTVASAGQYLGIPDFCITPTDLNIPSRRSTVVLDPLGLNQIRGWKITLPDLKELNSSVSTLHSPFAAIDSSLKAAPATLAYTRQAKALARQSSKRLESLQAVEKAVSRLVVRYDILVSGLLQWSDWAVRDVSSIAARTSPVTSKLSLLWAPKFDPKVPLVDMKRKLWLAVREADGDLYQLVSQSNATEKAISKAKEVVEGFKGSLKEAGIFFKEKCATPSLHLGTVVQKNVQCQGWDPKSIWKSLVKVEEQEGKVFAEIQALLDTLEASVVRLGSFYLSESKPELDSTKTREFGDANFESLDSLKEFAANFRERTLDSAAALREKMGK